MPCRPRGVAEADPRIQLADILAGAARKIASDALNGRGDPQLVELLGPYVDPASIWGDAHSRPGTPPKETAPS